MAQILIAALVIAGWAVVYTISRRQVKRACNSLRIELQGQIDALTQALIALERRASLPRQVTVSEEIAPGVLVEIEKAIAGLFGSKATVRSVKLLHPTDPAANQWARQGRVVVQASHNLARRGEA